MTTPSHVFVVGLPRSGTSLVRHLLNGSDAVAIASETHFFGAPGTRAFLQRALRGGETLLYNQRPSGIRRRIAATGDLRSDAGVRQVVDYLYTIDGQYWRWLHEHVTQEELVQRLLASERSERALFDLLMALFAGPKPIRGEKTPHHLFYVPTLLDWFPEAKIVHVLRDPRAVYVSHDRKPEFTARRRARGGLQRLPLTQLLYIGVSWLRAVRLDAHYRQQYPARYRLYRFEDLVARPQAQLAALCAFLDVELTDAMLQPAFQNSSFAAAANDSAGATSGFDTASAERWREHVHPLTDLFFRLWARRGMSAFGYRP